MAPTPAAPGWHGWAAHDEPTLAAPAGWHGWAAHEAPTLAAPAGWRGWAAGLAPNLHLTVRLPAGQAPADAYVPLTLALTYAPADPAYGPAEHLELPYPTGGQCWLSAPAEGQLTLALASPRYEPAGYTLALVPGQVAELVVQLAFRAGAPQATKVRRRGHRLSNESVLVAVKNKS